MSTTAQTAAVDPALVETWITGWALARETPPPVPDHGGYRVEVGWPDQRRRHVFSSIGSGLIDLGRWVEEPHVFLKCMTTAEALRAVLPARWTVETRGGFMGLDRLATGPTRGAGEGYRSQVIEEGSAQVVRFLSLPDRSEAAAGRVVLVDDCAIFDRIVVAPAHRRRGLGSALMGALGREARARGARRGLLIATEEGRALYESLGWRLLSPYASAVIAG